MHTETSLDRVAAAADTGPLLSAFQCDGLQYLRRYVARVHIAPRQVGEFVKDGADEWVSELIVDGFVAPASQLTDEEAQQASRLAGRIAGHEFSRDPDPASHLSEAELLVVAQRPELRCRLVLLDEKAARAVADAMGLRVTGFPGILARAGREGVLGAAEIRNLLRRCRQHGTHYSDELIEYVAETYGR